MTAKAKAHCVRCGAAMVPHKRQVCLDCFLVLTRAWKDGIKALRAQGVMR